MIIERSNILLSSFSLEKKFLTRESRDFDRSRGVKRKEKKKKSRMRNYFLDETARWVDWPLRDRATTRFFFLFSGVGERWKKIKIVRLRGSGVGVTLRWFDSADSEAFHIICHRYFRPGRSIHSPAFSRNESPITKVTSRERALNADYRFPSSFPGSSPESIFVPRVKLRWTSWHLLVPSNIFILETGINVTVVVYSVKIPFVKELLLYLVLYRWA